MAAARCVAGDAETLSYYLNCWQNLFSVQDAAGAVRLFRTEFFTVAGALTAVLFLGLSALGPLPIFLFTMLYGTGSGLLSSRLLVDLNPRTAFVLLCVCGIPASLAAGTLCVRRIRTAGKRKALFSRLRAWGTGSQHRRAFGSVYPDAVPAPAALRCGSGNAVSGRAGKTYLS